MDHKWGLPFEKNRYYVGKLLTSADFQAEQAYASSKRCFFNEIMFGSGIVCGLGVLSLDDLTVMVDSGVAMDAYGREIAMENAVVRKLSAIDGFEQLESSRALLCLEYTETPVHPIYTIGGQENGENYEYNRVQEGWRLFLQDSGRFEVPHGPELEFLETGVVYADEDYEVTCTMPAKTPCEETVRVCFTSRRLKESAPGLRFRAVVQAPAFFAQSGSHEFVAELTHDAREPELTAEYVLKAQQLPSEQSILLAESGSMRVYVGEQERRAKENFSMRARVAAGTVHELVDAAVSAPGLEMRRTGGDAAVVLAEIFLQRSKNTCFIEEIRTAGVRRYIRTAADVSVRRRLEGWFGRPMPAASLPGEVPQQAPAQQANAQPVYATGFCEIPLDVNMKRGQIAYSHEIIHGLGPGTVYVSVGVEYLAQDPKLEEMSQNTIYGNAQLFAQEHPDIPMVETAVKVMHDRGSFVAAARLLEESTQVVLPLRWVAVAMPKGVQESRLQQISNKSIAAVQPTVVLAVRETHYFNVRFNNMEPCALVYELTEPDSGTITPDGIYTAPGREGVFEIRISCADVPLINTYAYAVVKRKDDEKTGQGH